MTMTRLEVLKVIKEELEAQSDPRFFGHIRVEFEINYSNGEIKNMNVVKKKALT